MSNLLALHLSPTTEPPAAVAEENSSDGEEDVGDVLGGWVRAEQFTFHSHDIEQRSIHRPLRPWQ